MKERERKTDGKREREGWKKRERECVCRPKSQGRRGSVCVCRLNKKERERG